MKQKYLLVSLLFLALQLGVYYFELFFNVHLTQSTTDTWFFTSGTLLALFSIISIIKKESAAGGALIAFEIYLIFLLMMGHGG